MKKLFKSAATGLYVSAFVAACSVSLPAAAQISVHDVLRLRQQPIDNLKTLRNEEFKLRKQLRRGEEPIAALAAMGNQYEMDVELDPKDNDVAGFYLCCGEGRKVGISYDSASGYLTIDRTNSTDAKLPKFDRMAYSKIGKPGKSVGLRIFVDKSTVEVFADGGKKVFTLLTYAAPGQDGVKAFSMNGHTKIKLKAWPLKSIFD